MAQFTSNEVVQNEIKESVENVLFGLFLPTFLGNKSSVPFHINNAQLPWP